MDLENGSKDEMPYLFVDNAELEPTEKTHKPIGPTTAYPFKRWVNSIRSKRCNQPQMPERYVEGWPEIGSDEDCSNNSNLSPYHAVQEQQWEKLSGHSSQLGTVKTTSLSIMSQSVVRSRANTQSSANRSIHSDNRVSIDSMRSTVNPSIDEAALTRAIKRRQVLRELIQTESDYVLGLKALTDVLSFFLTRPEILYNLQRIHEIHERFLRQLQQVTPRSECVGVDLSALASQGLHKWLATLELPGFRSLHSKSRKMGYSKSTLNSRLKAIAADPDEALEVAREIEKLSLFFGAYEEFCSQYELLTEDLATLRRSIPNWQQYDQGIEALSKSVASVESRKHEEKRSMTLNDLLIKPIQRLCKYSLLLHDLLKHTASSDCPSSHDGIQQILDKLRVLVTRVNAATGNPVNRDRIRKTVLLQARLGFAELDPVQNLFRQLGPMTQCGVLHVTYQSPRYITGEYMVCTLFNSYFLLARMNDDYRKLQAVACLYIDDMKIDALDNGKGLCCNGSLFSWKVVFHDDDDNYELIFSASSATEEKQWKMEILKLAAALVETPKTRAHEPRKFSFLSLHLTPLDLPPPLTSTLSRRSSTHSLATSRLKHHSLQHVLIKKANYPHSTDGAVCLPDGEMGRSKTLSSPRLKLTLTPKREDRIRLERFISDIYTRDVLPFPGMALATTDLFSRTTSLIIRRISLHTGFTKRSTSLNMGHASSISEEARSREGSEEGKEDPVGNVKLEESKESEGEKIVMSEPCPEWLAPGKAVKLKGVQKRATDPAPVPRKKSSIQGTLRGTFSLRRRKKPRSSLPMELSQ